MRKLFVVVALATGACQSRNDVATQNPYAKPADNTDPWVVPNTPSPAPAASTPQSEPPATTTSPGVGYEARSANTPTRSSDTNANPVMTDQDFQDARASFAADLKARVDSLETRISQLEGEARNLRSEKDELAKQLATVPEQTRQDWDHFKANIRDALSRLEEELNARR